MFPFAVYWLGTIFVYCKNHSFSDLWLSWHCQLQFIRSGDWASLFLTKIIQKASWESVREKRPRRRSLDVWRRLTWMLEHDRSLNDFAEEVFRDSIVANLWKISYGSMLAEEALFPQLVKRKLLLCFLVSYYQYYTVALYVAISFSLPLFGRLLLPPTSLRYAPDHRKHLWCDFTIISSRPCSTQRH